MARPRPARSVLALLALTAPALLVLGTATPSYAGTLCGTPVLQQGDCTPPTAVVYRAWTSKTSRLAIEPGGQTPSPTAAFWIKTAAADPDGNKVTYSCRLTRGETVVDPWRACTDTDISDATSSLGSADYANLTPGDYTFSVKAKDAATNGNLLFPQPAPNEQADPGTQFSWTVVEPVDDHDPPQTTITSALERWHLLPFASVDYVGDEPLKDADCTLQGRSRNDACDASQAFMSVTAGDWELKVAGIDVAGNVDPTPAVNRFTVPVPSSKLKASKGWTRGTKFGYFFDGYSTTKKKGATLSAARAGTRSVALVATKCPGCGSVKVTYGGKVVKKVSLAASSTRRRQLVPIVTWGSGHGGTVAVTVTSSGKPVTIEGLGFSKRP